MVIIKSERNAEITSENIKWKMDIKPWGTSQFCVATVNSYSQGATFYCLFF